MPWSNDVKLVDDDGERPKKSKAAPVLDGGVSINFLVMVHLGDTSDQIWYSTLESGASQWGPDQRVLSLRSRLAPAMASGHLLFVDARTDDLFHASFSGGWVFNDEDPRLRNARGETTGNNVHPALAGRDRNRMHLVVWNHSGSRIGHQLMDNRRLLDPFETIGNQDQGTFRTKARPAIALIGDTLHVVHLGADSNQLWHAQGQLSFDSSGRLSVEWPEEKKIGGQKSRATPALAVFNGRLHMVHIGDTSTTLWHAIYIPELDSWTQTEIPGQKSKTTPGLAAFGNRLHMVHLGEESNQIWWSRWRDP